MEIANYVDKVRLMGSPAADRGILENKQLHSATNRYCCTVFAYPDVIC